jgi:hypothetical protein
MIEFPALSPSGTHPFSSRFSAPRVSIFGGRGNSLPIVPKGVGLNWRM